MIDKLLPESSPKPRFPGDIATTHSSIVVFGKQARGKTTVGAILADELRARFDHVWAFRTKMDLPAVFDHLPTPSWISESKGTRAVFVFIDDMTKAVQKIKPTTLRESYLSRMYDIRGEIYKACGMDQGAIVVVMGVHRFYGAHIDLRADVDLLIALSTGTLGTNDERTVKKMLGPTTFDALRKTEGPVATGWAGWATKTDNGMVHFTPPDRRVVMPLVGSRETAPMPLAGAIAAILFFFIPLFFIAWAYWLILKRPHP